MQFVKVEAWRGSSISSDRWAQLNLSGKQKKIGGKQQFEQQEARGTTQARHSSGVDLPKDCKVGQIAPDFAHLQWKVSTAENAHFEHFVGQKYTLQCMELPESQWALRVHIRGLST